MTKQVIVPQLGDVVMTPRVSFCAVVSAGPLLKAEAIVVLCGEDAEPRVDAAIGCMQQGGAAVLLLSGGKHEPPRYQSAHAMGKVVLAKGVSWTHLVFEKESQNTKEQADNVLRIAKEKEWRRLLVVASPYHAFRAVLTFVAALDRAGLAESVQIVNVPSAQSRWFEKPAHMDETRVELLAREFAKIAEYQATGDCASYERGLAYLQFWEGK